MAGFWSTRKKEREQLAAQAAGLARRADAPLVAAYETHRTSADDLSCPEL